METAIQCIYRDLEYAKSLIEAKRLKNVSHQPKTTESDSNMNNSEDDPDAEEEEESWTFVGGDDSAEPDLFVKKGALAGVETHRRGPLGSKLLGQDAAGLSKLRAAPAATNPTRTID